MALNWVALHILRPHIRGRVLCFGYPTIVLKREHCEAFLGFMPERFTTPPEWMPGAYVLAKRVEKKPLTFPIQGKYAPRGTHVA